MLLFACPDNPEPSGGVRTIYRHVDLLNRNKIPATILHNRGGFRPAWFEHSTPIAYLNETNAARDDIFVLPEIFGPQLADTLPHVRKVIFNQNAYTTFKGYRIDRDIVTPYTHPEVIAAICMSEDNRQYLQAAFPKLRLFRLRYSIDPKLFHPAAKVRRIAFMPRKNAEDAVQVINLLRLRGALRDYEVVPIDKLAEADAARIVRESLIFLSFGYPEGFGLPPAEAMACGCAVIGYHGNGGREFFLPEHSFPVTMGDIQEFVATVERVIVMHRDQPETLKQLTERAAAFIAENYSPQREEQELVSCWRAILSLAPSGAPVER